MRTWLLWPRLVPSLWKIGCAALLAGSPACSPIDPAQVRADSEPPPPPGYGYRYARPPHLVGQLDDRMVVFQFDGGEVDLELFRSGNRIEQVARNRYIVPVMLQWSIDSVDNAALLTPPSGVAMLPAASEPGGLGPPVVLAQLQQLDPTLRYHRELSYHARLGDPRARPASYVYGLPYRRGLAFSVLQGFHGAFSHTGSNEYAVDFNCPVATPIIATRAGVVVAVNASAQGSGTTPEFLDDRRANFVIVLHSDGTLGEYMHLSPSCVEVKPGQSVKRGDELGLSGNTGFSTTPHLHFQVMTAADDGIAKQSFPFVFAISKTHSSAPEQGKRYPAWE